MVLYATLEEAWGPAIIDSQVTKETRQKSQKSKSGKCKAKAKSRIMENIMDFYTQDSSPKYEKDNRTCQVALPPPQDFQSFMQGYTESEFASFSCDEAAYDVENYADKDGFGEFRDFDKEPSNPDTNFGPGQNEDVSLQVAKEVQQIVAQSQMVPSQLVPSQMVPSQLVPSQMVPSQMVPSQMVPSQLGQQGPSPSQSGPSQLVSNQLGQLAPSQLGPHSNQRPELVAAEAFKNCGPTPPVIFFEMMIYIASGILLIFLMDQMVKLGMMMRK